MTRAARPAIVAVAVWFVLSGCGSTVPRGTAPTTPRVTPSTASSTTSPTTSPSSTSLPPPPPSTSTTVPSHPAALITKGKTERPLDALTFDAGSDAGNAEQILGILALNHIHATFGVTGLWAQSNPGLVREIATAGDQIVNHSWDHRSFTGYSTKTEPLSAAQIVQELSTTEDLIRSIAGTGTSGWFRPPYGDRHATVDAVAGAAGYRYDLMWTVDTLAGKAYRRRPW